MIREVCKLIKQKGVLKVSPIFNEFEDSFNAIKIRPFSLHTRGIFDFGVLTKSHPAYDSLIDFINKVNLFKPRVEVPNKKVISKVIGESKLLRDQSTGIIKLVYRNKGITTEGGIALSANTCYIDKQTSFEFYREAFVENTRYGTLYYVSPNHSSYKYWNDYMDKEYARLAGDKYLIKFTKPLKPERTEDRERALNAYSEAKRGSDLKIIEDFTKEGLCKMDGQKTCIYDKNGYFICEVSEAKAEEGSGMVIVEIIDWLDRVELKVARKILSNYLISYI